MVGVAEDFFKVEGAIATNPVDSGVVTAAFPATPETIDIAAISGIAVPVTGAAPVREIAETAQYRGTVTWNPDVSDMFVSNTHYTATITLSPKDGYTLSGIPSNYFIVAGATSATNNANSGLVEAMFPVTSANVAVVSDYTNTGVGVLKAVQGGTFHNGTVNMTVSSFRMSRHEVTRAQFLAVMGTDPSDLEVTGGTSDPVQNVRWYYAIAFCNKLSLAEGLTPVYSVSGITDWAGLPYSAIPNSSNEKPGCGDRGLERQWVSVADGGGMDVRCAGRE
jgi:hypothetical protein